jgi:hypothetical protein
MRKKAMKKSSLYGNWYPKKEDVLKALCFFLPVTLYASPSAYIPVFTW